MDGIFIIDKPKGVTSHDIVSKMRKILNTKSIGHAGTLDPIATGVLPILVGKGTKISKYLIEHNKEYIATIQLGEKTDTGDSEGKIINKKEININNLSEENITRTLNEMIGKQKQIPPMYSAIKINGKKLYEYAREGIDIKPEPREIEIHNIELIKIDISNKTVVFKVLCSKGTYIRVLCEKIAEKLDTYGHMKELRRTMVDRFLIKDAIKLEDVKEDKIITIETIFENYPKIELNETTITHFLNGVLLTNKVDDGLYRIYNNDNKFLGLGIVKNELLKRDVILD